MKTVRIVLLGLSLILGIAPHVSADSVTFELNTEFSGATPPAGPAPWLTATFTDLVGGGVRLTLTSNLTNQEYINEWYFNLNPDLDPTSLVFQNYQVVGGALTPPDISTGLNAHKAKPDGYFDIVFTFQNQSQPPWGRFGSGDSLSVDITRPDGLTAADFAYLSVNGSNGSNGKSFGSVAKIQGIGPDDESGWIADSPAPVPEPATLLLLGTGLIGFAWRSRNLFKS